MASPGGRTESTESRCSENRGVNASRTFTSDAVSKRRRVYTEEWRTSGNRVTRATRPQKMASLDTHNPGLALERMERKHTAPTAEPRVSATVVFFHTVKHFGFVRLEDNTDVFFHRNDSPEIDPARLVKGL